jgi:hypothetical protein
MSGHGDMALRVVDAFQTHLSANVEQHQRHAAFTVTTLQTFLFLLFKPSKQYHPFLYHTHLLPTHMYHSNLSACL